MKTFKEGDWVKYKIMCNDEYGNKTDEVLEEGETEVLGIEKNGNIQLDTGSGLLALPEECEKISPKYKVSDFVEKGNYVYFDSYRAGFFYYNIERWKGTGGEYQFPIPIEDTNNATLLAEDKSVSFMRWIRKAIQDGTMIKKPLNSK
jgi:hypothetical protein